MPDRRPPPVLFSWSTTAAVVLPAMLLAALVWGAALALIGQEQADAEREARRHNANLAIAFEQHTARTLGSVEHVLRYVAHEYALRGRSLDLRALAGTGSIGDPAMRSLSVLDDSGTVVAGSQPPGTRLADRDYFIHHRDTAAGAIRIGAPVARRNTGETIIPVSLRISAADGRFLGVVAAGLDPEYFSGFYRQIDIGANGMVLLVGLDGTTRARRAGALSTAGQDMRGSTLLQQQALSEHGEFVSAGRLEGVRRFTSYRTLRESGLVIAVGTSEQEVLSGYETRRRRYLGAAALSSVLIAAVAVLVLLSARRRREFLDRMLRNEARFHATFDQSSVGIAHGTLDGTFVKVNPALCRLTGYSEAELLGRNFLDLKPPQERESGRRGLKAMVAGGLVQPSETTFLRKDGTPIWVAVAPALVRDPQGRPDYWVAMVQDVSERKAAQEKVLHQAQFDLLTDLPNRALFADRLAHALSQARRQRWTAGVMFMDLDRFKAVNDTLGHAAGDALLREVARRLADSVRSSDTAARIGGDEFAVVLSQISQASDAVVVAEKILAAMAAPMRLEGREHVVTVSIGIALFPLHASDDESLMRHADAAMFEAKQAGRNALRLYSDRVAIAEGRA